MYVHWESDEVIPKLKEITIVLIESKWGKLEKKKESKPTLACEQLSMAKKVKLKAWLGLTCTALV